MKKITKTLAFMSALCLTASMAAALPISAAEVKGDVDGDGYVTGHDAAVVSRYLHEGDVELTEAQLAIADVDGNGKVEQADADWMQANREYAIGDSDLTGEIITEPSTISGFVIEFSLFDAYEVMMTINVPLVYEEPRSPYDEKYYTPLMRNLSDVNGDNQLNIHDAYCMLLVNSFQACGIDGWEHIYENGRYYFELNDSRIIKYREKHTHWHLMEL